MTQNSKGNVQTSIFLDPVLWKKTKIVALETGMTCQDIVAEALNLWFQKKGRK